jgi:hypothetical protein
MPHKNNADRPPLRSEDIVHGAELAGIRGGAASARGSLTLWIEDPALKCRQTRGPGCQSRYSDVAVQANLMLRTAFELPLRQTEELLHRFSR